MAYSRLGTDRPFTVQFIHLQCFFYHPNDWFTTHILSQIGFELKKMFEI